MTYPNLKSFLKQVAGFGLILFLPHLSYGQEVSKADTTNSLKSLIPLSNPVLGELSESFFAFPDQRFANVPFNTLWDAFDSPRELLLAPLPFDEKYLRGKYFVSETTLKAFRLLKAEGDYTTAYKLLANESELLKWLGDSTRVGRTLAPLPAGKLWLITHIESRLPPSRGFSPRDSAGTLLPPPYAGPNLGGSLRLRYQNPNWMFSLVAAQDPGEAFRLSNNQWGTDFTSFSLRYKPFEGRSTLGLRQLIVGDYQMEIGQGLILPSGFRMGYGTEPIVGLWRTSEGMRPYTSLAEAGFLRGISAEFQPHKNWFFQPFASYRPIDGRIKSQTTNPDIELTSDFVSSLSQTGLHRTIAEQAARYTLYESMAGLFSGYRTNQSQLAIGVLQSQWSAPIQPKESSIVRGMFSGRQNTNLSLSGYTNLGDAFTYGEFALSANGGYALQYGLMLPMARGWELHPVLRLYAPNYQAVYSNAMGQQSRNNNEQGLYLGWKKSLRQGEKALKGYVDFYRFPALTARVQAAGANNVEIMLGYETNQRKVRTWHLYWRGTFNQITTSSAGNDPLTIIQWQQRHLAVAERRFLPFGNYQLAFRLQGSLQHSFDFLNSDDPNSSEANMPLSPIMPYGTAISVRHSYEGSWLKAQLMNAFFFSPSGSNLTQWINEPEVLWAYGLYSFSGTGFRNTALLTLKKLPIGNLYLKVGHTLRIDGGTFGSGNQTIRGNQLLDLGLLLKQNF